MTDFVKATVSRFAVPLAAVIGIASTVALPILLYKDIGGDFGVYWRAANEPLSMAYLKRDALNFPYPPTMLLWISPLALIPKWVGYGLWLVCSIVALAISCWRLLSKSEIALALFSLPIVYCLIAGQVSIMMAALLIFACVTPDRRMAGVALAVIASIKPQLVLLAPALLLFARDWRALIWAAGAFAFLAAVSAAVFGIGSWLAWIEMLDHFQRVVVRNGVLSVVVTPAGAALSRGFPPMPFAVGGAGVGLWLLYRCARRGPLHQAAAIATGGLLTAPYAAIYDLAAVTPFLARACFRGRLDAAVALSGGFSPLPVLITGWLLGRPQNHSGRSVTIRDGGVAAAPRAGIECPGNPIGFHP